MRIMFRIPIVTGLLKFTEGLRFRQLFLLVGALFLIDFLLPDPIPFIDEILLGLLTLLLAAWRKDKSGNRLPQKTREPS